jgi:hypothetical protein
MPGPRVTIHERRKAVDGNERGNNSGAAKGFQSLPDGAVIGLVTRMDALLARGAIQTDIARYGLAVAFSHDQSRVVEPPVAVDDQARESGKHRGAIKVPGEAAGEIGGADVPRNVAISGSRRQTKYFERRRDLAARVIADDESGGASRRIVK